MSAETGALYEQALAAMQGPDAERAYALASALCAADSRQFEYQHMAGITALASSRGGAALTHFGAAVRLAGVPQFGAVAWCGIGHAHLMLENPQDAETAFRRAFSLVYEFPPALGGLAEALAREGRFAEAEQAGRRALELGLDEARLHVSLGRACLGEEKLAEAEAEFRQAIALDPAAPEPRFGLGTIAKTRGHFDEAMSRYREVLARMPEFPGYGQFASLKTFAADDEDLRLLERCLAQLPPQTPGSARSDLLFALAKAYDDAGQEERAIRCLEEGNRLEGERMAYDPGEDEARMQRIETLFTRDFITRFEGTGLVGLRPIFVVSLPRSGSTLTEQILAAHTQIRGGGEIAHFGRVATALSLKWGARADFPNVEEATAREDLREAAREYAKLTAALRLITPYFTDKSLYNFLYVGLIRMMLPEAKIVHVRRHPLATVLGLYRQRFTRGIGYSFDLELIVRYYRAYARLMRHWRQAVPEAFTELFYERLVADPEHEIRRVLDYVGLAFEPRCLEFYKLERPVRTASVAQVRQPLNREGLIRHRRYEKLLAPVAVALSEEIAAYEAELAEGMPGPDAAA